MPGVRKYLSVFWGILLTSLKLPHYLSDGCALLVEVLGAIFGAKNEAFEGKLIIIFSASVIFFVKIDLPERRKSP